MRDKLKIDFYFDFLSPFSYLANHRLNEISVELDAEVIYHSIDLGRAKVAIGNVGPSNRDLPIKLAYLSKDLQRWARLYGLPLKFVPNFNTRQLNTGMFYASREGRDAEYVRLAFHRTWGMGGAPDDEDVLQSIAAEMGWNAERFLGFVNSEEGATVFQDSTSEAIARHVFGVPTMMLGDEMWWGNDRLSFMETFLKKRPLK